MHLRNQNDAVKVGSVRISKKIEKVSIVRGNFVIAINIYSLKKNTNRS
jgi:hypothetical protein